MADKLEASSIPEIRQRLTMILKGLFEVLKCTFQGFAKVLYLSIFLVITDAMRYMRKYYSDDSYDNMFVDGNLRELWDQEGKPHLTPLRKWELKGKYQIAKSAKLSRKEAYLVLYYTVPTLLVLVFALAVIFLDYEFVQVTNKWNIECKFTFSWFF